MQCAKNENKSTKVLQSLCLYMCPIYIHKRNKGSLKKKSLLHSMYQALYVEQEKICRSFFYEDTIFQHIKHDRETGTSNNNGPIEIIS